MGVCASVPAPICQRRRSSSGVSETQAGLLVLVKVVDPPAHADGAYLLRMRTTGWTSYCRTGITVSGGRVLLASPDSPVQEHVSLAQLCSEDDIESVAVAPLFGSEGPSEAEGVKLDVFARSLKGNSSVYSQRVQLMSGGSRRVFVARLVAEALVASGRFARVCKQTRGEGGGSGSGGGSATSTLSAMTCTAYVPVGKAAAWALPALTVIFPPPAHPPSTALMALRGRIGGPSVSTDSLQPGVREGLRSLSAPQSPSSGAAAGQAQRLSPVRGGSVDVLPLADIVQARPPHSPTPLSLPRSGSSFSAPTSSMGVLAAAPTAVEGVRGAITPPAAPLSTDAGERGVFSSQLPQPASPSKASSISLSRSALSGISAWLPWLAHSHGSASSAKGRGVSYDVGVAGGSAVSSSAAPCSLTASSVLSGSAVLAGSAEAREVVTGDGSPDAVHTAAAAAAAMQAASVGAQALQAPASTQHLGLVQC